MIRLHIPFPPSVNQLFPGKVRRHKSKRYESWIKEAGLMLNEQYIVPVHGLVQVTYLFGKPDKRRRDIDNLFKACNDLLVAHGIIEDDSNIQKIGGEWADIEGCDVEISPYVKKVAN